MKNKIPHIKAVVVNHNTSKYAELMLRSLYANNDLSKLNFSMVIFDNHSKDNVSRLKKFAVSNKIPFTQTNFNTKTKYNSHGKILTDFILHNSGCDYYLLLDADIVFIQKNTINRMIEEIKNVTNAYGIGARMSWDGIKEIPMPKDNPNIPDVYNCRLHPCCALIKNTPIFRKVAKEAGLMCVKRIWADHEEYIDTCQLMTSVMRTHGLRHLRSSKMVIHFFCVSYNWEPKYIMDNKRKLRDNLLLKYKNQL